MTLLFVLNDAPAASERDYNALRLATSLAENRDHTVTVFLLGDGVLAAVAGQSVPEGAPDIPWMLRRLGAGGTRILACGTCMDQRGVTEASLIEEAA
ncbi:MAG TPA: DsrE family protein, partial [Bryobacteraceae bacterium]|nr:DsrE family protein [Bryobacteraceae bacterium]